MRSYLMFDLGPVWKLLRGSGDANFAANSESLIEQVI
jgi:hypothetical protein